MYALQRPKDSVPYLTKDTDLVFRVYDVCITGLVLKEGQRISDEVFTFIANSEYFSTVSLSIVSKVDWTGIRDRESVRRVGEIERVCVLLLTFSARRRRVA